ncbi:penicillin acylase family protein [Steroidobacter sp. S1-65]|uniref:Penicillin acylase family protein n=1 Tax=Steroidobacter gossypii TaxID=2805490 RepID=A0ABS1X3Y9_9GAMM|nr:penicillin acylase family protein [Steroidobacter gossypii]MBM0107940.1 penicillin acylase family protein [Steroidobacter gossypii]
MRLLRPLRNVALAVLIVLVIGVLAGYFALRASLPRLDGNITAAQVSAPASIERDGEGTPVLRASTRSDLAYATGFAHAQDRYFQMDLMRRAAAGEMAELLGPAVLEADRKLRVHGFRQVAREVLAAATENDRALIEAYAAGANFALSEARAKPWEYLLLGEQPAPWQPEDSVLVAFSMYLNLNDSSGADELARLQLYEALPPTMFAFLAPLGTEWDAPIAGGTIRSATIPSADIFDLRTGAARAAALSAPRTDGTMEEKTFVGSNSWAVAGSHTVDKAALLANDMHLGLRLPHVWYRARMIVEAEGDARRDLVGVTLPGLPVLIVGSNGNVAWGFTNSFGDWTDLIIVERDPQDATRYLTPEGSEPFEVRDEILRVKDGDPERLRVLNTRWGPIVREEASNRLLALAWTAHHAQATNFRMLDLETADNVEAALLAANRSGVPVQNFLAVDAGGRIGWTLMGQVPVRGKYDSTMPYLWNTPDAGWMGWRKPEEYPRIVDPAAGRLWTANARTIDVESWLSFMGDGMYDNGARATQIRDDLLALESANARDMVNIQLDDRALFLVRWRDFLLELLNTDAVKGQPLRAEARKYLEDWSARAAAEDVGYRLVRAMRLQIRKDIFESLTAVARIKYPETKFAPSAQFEGPLWQLITRQPAHMLDPRFGSWEEALLASVDAALQALIAECNTLSQCTWGAQNTLVMRHPLSQAVPFIGRWLDMPAQRLSGDAFMPRVQGPSFGASQRMVVSPGREAEGYFQMPGGPVDHPLSPFYGAGHNAWAHGEPRPLLPGDPRHTLKLLPGAATKQ